MCALLPGDPQALTCAAKLLLLRARSRARRPDDLERTLERLDQALRAEPPLFSALCLRGQVRGMREPGAGIDDLERAFALRRTQVVGRALVDGVTHATSQRLAEWDQAGVAGLLARLTPAVLAQAGPEAAPIVQALRGRAAALELRYDRAERELRAALAATPRGQWRPSIMQMLAQTLLERAVRHPDPQAADALARAASELASAAPGLRARGTALAAFALGPLGGGQPAQAQALAKQALSGGGRDALALAFALTVTGADTSDEALAAWKAVSTPGDPFMRSNYASMLVSRAMQEGSLERLEQGLGALTELRRRHPRDPLVLERQAWALGRACQLHARRGDVPAARAASDAALAALDLALEVEPDHFGALRERGLLRVLRDDDAGAVVDLRRAVTVHPDAALERMLREAEARLARAGKR
ncbi:MAG: hypothetical protein AB7N76_23285 [Planctomycetota bacterium]